MKVKQYLRTFVIALVILVITMPAAIVITIITHPFWLWFEKASGIESYGHSGPAEWCYLVIYLILVACIAYLWLRLYLSGKRNNR